MVSISKETLLGAHISVAGGYYKAFERGESIECTTIQIFTKSNRTWSAKPIDPEDAEQFKESFKKSSIKKIVAHAGYLINLASSSAATRRLSFKSLKEELIRAEMLEIPTLVLHPGSHTGGGEEQGMLYVAEALNELFKEIKGETAIALETMAGQGSSIGQTFENLRFIYDKCRYPQRVGICMDTCHLFAAGYDLTNRAGYEAVMKEFKHYFNFKELLAIHLNDSKDKQGAKKDRHANIGKGHIPLEVFKAIMHDPHLVNIPKILETPVKTLVEYEKEIKLLREL